MLKSRWAQFIAGCLCLLCFSNASFASRTLVPAGSPFVVDSWSIEDGLPQSSVISVAQGRDGYLWIGTLNGLVRFDGVRFTLFDEANTPGLESSRVLTVFEDTRARLWVGTENGTVSMIDTNGLVRSFTVGQGTSGGRVTICEDSRGVIWMLTATGFLGQHEADKFNLWKGFETCKAIIAEKGGDIWLGYENRMQQIQRASVTVAISKQEVQLPGRLDFLLASRSGGYWRLADGRVQKCVEERLQRDLGPYPWGDTPVLSACEDADGNLIVGTYGNGVYWFQSNRRFIHLKDELSHPSVLSVMVDREGNLWVGTNGGGLNRIKRRTFQTLAESEGLVVQSVSEAADGALWVGYNGASRVDFFHGGTNQSFQIVQNSRIAANCDVKSVLQDRNGRLLVGVRFNGNPTELPFRVFEFRNDRFQLAPEAAAVSDSVSAMFQDSKGVIWIGTQSGLVRASESDLRVFGIPNGLAGNDVRAICEDRQGSIWVATSTGLSGWNNGEFTTFRKAEGLPSDDLSCLYIDSDGDLWVGTRGSGLVRFHKGKWIHHTTADGLSGNSIGYVIEDGDANLWIGSNAGLMRIGRKSLNDFAAGAEERLICRTYVEGDGLPSRECTQGSQPAALRARDGRLWFPTTKGLVSVLPSNLKKNPFQPPVTIESILVAGAEQITNRLRPGGIERLIIPPGKEQIEIHYTSLNLGAAERTRFRYQLEGHDPGWIYAGNVREARYSKLGAGTYRFLVTAANEDGVWNPTAAVQLVQVNPPFWRTRWFLVLLTLSLLGLIVAIVHYFSTQRLQRELAEFKRQEELEKERARIARDLHDQLGANLTQVALLGELAEADKHLPEEVEGHAKQIYETARETTKALDEIVWAVNPSNDTLDGLVNYICKYAQEYYELAGLRYRIEVPADLPKLPLQPEVRHNVFLAAKEAVNNVVKHAQASSAWLRLHMEPAEFTIEIEDDGRGPAGMNEKTGRNGLRNMRKRLEDIGGAFSIGPAARKGTVVRLKAPIKNG